MLLKTAGGLLVIGAASVGGILAAERIRDRYEQLRYLQKLFCLLRSEILYARADLGEAFGQISRSARTPYREWLLGLCGEMEQRDGRSFAALWEEQTRGQLGNAGLSAEAMDRLVDFGSRLGTADTGLQAKNLELYLDELRTSMDEMREGMGQKIRLCHCLGVMGGIFITVLLI